jgi:hypothetical protein
MPGDTYLDRQRVLRSGNSDHALVDDERVLLPIKWYVYACCWNDQSSQKWANK